MKLKIILFLLATNLTADATNTTINYINELRTNAGLIPYTTNPTLTTAAQNHANYLKEEKYFAHDEKNSSNVYYTGEWVWNRLEHLKYDFSVVNENISINTPTPQNSIDTLFQAIYHRLGFLSFDTQEIGIGVIDSEDFGNIFVYNMATQKPEYSNDIRLKNPKLILWPYSGYSNAQPAFFNTEFPAPLQECKKGGASGNPISIQFNPNKNAQIQYNSFTLIDEKANIIETKQISDNLNSNEFVFFPKDRLDWETKYSATFKYNEDGETKEEKWNFKTRELNHPILALNDTEKTYNVSKNSTYALYIKPKDCLELPNSYSYDASKISLSEVDSNTIYMKVKADIKTDFSIEFSNNKTYHFHTFTNEISQINFSNITKNSITINWVHENLADESGYKIYRDGKLIYTATSDASSYTDNNLNPNTTYKYTIKVTNDPKLIFPQGEFGEIELSSNYTIADGAYFVDIRNDWERDVYGGYAKDSVVVTYEFRQEHLKDEKEDKSKRELNPNFVQQISNLVDGDKEAHIIIICATGGRTGAYGDRSKASAAKLLSENGFRAIEHIKGGSFATNGWKYYNLPWIER